MRSYASSNQLLTDRRPSLMTTSPTHNYYSSTYSRAYSKAYPAATPISTKDRFKPPVTNYDSPSRKPPLGPGPLDSSGNRIINNLRPKSRTNARPSGPVRANHQSNLQNGYADSYRYGASPSHGTHSLRGRSPARDHYGELSTSSSRRYGNISPSNTGSRLRHSNSIGNIVSEIDKMHFSTLSTPTKSKYDTGVGTTRTTPSPLRRTSSIGSIKSDDISTRHSYDRHFTTSSRRASQETITDLHDFNKSTSSNIGSKKSQFSASGSNGLPEITTKNLAARNDRLNKNEDSVKDKTGLGNKGSVGLRNLGNTCFFNSITQCLSNCRPLLDYCLSADYKTDLNTVNGPLKGNFVRAYAELMQEMWSTEQGGCVSPDGLYKALARLNPTLGNRGQHDAHECLVTMLDHFHEEVNLCRHKKYAYLTEQEEEKMSESEKAKHSWNNYIKNNKSKIADLFCGQLKSTLTCANCGHKSSTFETFFDLSLPISKEGYGSVELEDCFKMYAKEELLEGKNMPFCTNCKKARKMYKEMKINKFPKVLVLHLKRFGNSSSYGGFCSKIEKNVSFPHNHLDLSEFAADKNPGTRCMYNLFGVSNHSGSLRGGHYTAYAKNPFSQKWYSFNDSRAHSAPNSFSGSAAYVLFYENVDASSHL